MSRFNTGNPIGSADPRDRDDNTKNLDVAMQQQGGTWTDRLGVKRPTLSSAIDPTGLAQAAASSAQEAREAKDAILQSSSFSDSGVYETIALGLSATGEGGFFWVLPNTTDNLDDMTLYKKESGVAVYFYTNYNLESYMIEEGANWETGEL